MGKSSGWWLLVTLSVVVGFAALCAADQKSGTMAEDVDVLVPGKGHPLFGTFESASNNQISFTTDSGAPITISWDKIKELHIRRKTTLRAKQPLAPPSPSKSVDLDGPTIRPDKNDFILAGPGGNLTVPKANVISILPASTPAGAPPSPVAWTVSIAPTAGSVASLTSGTQSQQTLGLQVFVKREQSQRAIDWHHQTTTLVIDANNNLTQQSGTPSIRTHQYDASFKHRIYLWRGLYAQAVAEGYHNSSLNLYLEQSYGGGLGRTLYEDARNNLEVTGNLLDIGEHFYGNAPSVNFAAVSLQERYTRTLRSLKGGPLLLFEGGSYIPALNQKKAWQTRGTVGLKVPISNVFGLTFAFTDDYMENAPNGRKNYSTSSVSLTFKFPPPQK